MWKRGWGARWRRGWDEACQGFGRGGRRRGENGYMQIRVFDTSESTHIHMYCYYKLGASPFLSSEASPHSRCPSLITCKHRAFRASTIVSKPFWAASLAEAPLAVSGRPSTSRSRLSTQMSRLVEVLA